MTARMVYPMRYTCNECRTRILGYDDELPEGWERVQQDPGGFIMAMVEHLCAKCLRAKEESR